MRHLADSFFDSAFGHTADGRALFMPFGLLGGRYLIDSRQQIMLRRGLRWLMPLAMLPIMALLPLFIRPIRNAYAMPLFALVAGSFLLFTLVFWLWVRHVSRGLDRIDAQADDLPMVVDPHAAIVRRLIDRFRPPRTPSPPESFGVLAGFACQLLVRARAQRSGMAAPLIEVATVDGRLRYFGDALNGLVAEDGDSLLVHAGNGLPVAALAPIFTEMTNASVGDGAEYAGFIALLQRHWSSTALLLRGHGVAIDDWPALLARASRQWALDEGDASPRPTLLFMRAAIAMSKIDPAEILVPDDEPEPARR